MPTYLSVGEKGRSRSKSPGGRDRDRDRSNSRDTRRTSDSRDVRKSSKYDSPSESEDDRRRKSSSKKYYESESEDDRRRPKKSSSKKYSESESEESDRHRKSSKSKKHYESDSDDRKRSSKKSSTRRRSESESERDRKSSKSKKSSGSSKKKSEKSESESGSEDINISIHRKSSKSKQEEPKQNGQYTYAQPAPYAYAPPGQFVADPRVAYQNTRHASYIDPHLVAVRPDPTRAQSFSAPQYEQRPSAGYIASRDRDPAKQYIKTYNDRGEAQYVEIKPEAKPEKKYREDRYDRHGKKYNEDKYGSTEKKMEYLAIGGGLGASLTVAGQGARRSSDAGNKPPASPLLEAYKGTYQSMSPMPPSALVLHNHRNDSDLSDFDLSESDSGSDIDPRDPNAELKRKIRKLEREKKRHEEQKKKEAKKHINEEKKIMDTRDRSDLSITTIEPDYVKKGRKTVFFYDPEPDAKRIAAALAGTHKAPNTKPLMEILPNLSTDDLFALRTEYKKHAKTAGQGINIAKHIKTRVPGNIGKAAYATALGRWESEAFWANSWYQAGASRRELLIESLMGRSNSDIREIKNCFKDKKYGDDLEKCMKAELKADKFRTAILLALEEKRMPDGMGLDLSLIQSDIQRLHRALIAPSGGETEMIQIIVVRSDAHLRDVLKLYDAEYGRNFARDMIERSKNLVGETLAHILNGALNRPMRDALLLHQAISETAPGKERAELLISRLVRLHWEPKHLERVKMQYMARYKVPVESAIKKDVVDLVKSEEAKQWGEFCIELAKSCRLGR